jgi:putative DNA primase/helicase
MNAVSDEHNTSSDGHAPGNSGGKPGNGHTDSEGFEGLAGARLEQDNPPDDDDPPIDDEAELARLARLKPLDFERVAAAAAERLGLPVAILRRLVTQQRRLAERGGGQGQQLRLPEIEPWSKPVDGGQLLDAVTGAIRRYVIMGLSEARVIALWVVAGHCSDSFPVFARLFVTAAEKQCGKTTLLDVLSLLVPRPMAVSNTSPPALFRAIAMFRPTMLLDEFDGYTKETAEELRQLINAGHKRGGAALRLVGDNHEPRLFDVYGPMAIAAIDAIAATLMDRAIIIRLRRRLASEEIMPLRLDRAPEMRVLARQIARWADDHAVELAEADPVMGDAINRAADNWRPLFAVADLAGGGWRDLADDAAATVMANALDTASVRTLLLTDIRAAFAASGADRLSSEAVVSHLVELEHRPWPEWGKTRKPITGSFELAEPADRGGVASPGCAPPPLQLVRATVNAQRRVAGVLQLVRATCLTAGPGGTPRRCLPLRAAADVAIIAIAESHMTPARQALRRAQRGKAASVSAATHQTRGGWALGRGVRLQGGR